MRTFPVASEVIRRAEIGSEGSFKMTAQLDTQSRRLVALASLAIIVLFQGCVANLPAVRDFSQNTIVAAASFDSIADDLPKSCIRRVELELAPDEKIIVDNKRVEYAPEYVTALSKCTILKSSLDGILQVNAVLKGYAEALGKLASDDAVTFTQEVDALEANLKQININGSNPFDGPKATAVSELARFLSKAALDGYRQKKLRETIQVGHKHLEQIVGGLGDVAGDYKAILRNEKQNVITNQNLIVAQRTKGKTTVELDKKLLETKQTIAAIETKERAAEDYKTILRKIAETHKGLYISAESGQLDSALLIAEVQKYAAQLTPLVNEMRMAFGR